MHLRLVGAEWCICDRHSVAKNSRRTDLSSAWTYRTLSWLETLLSVYHCLHDLAEGHREFHNVHFCVLYFLSSSLPEF